jgi:hypothetical protein
MKDIHGKEIHDVQPSEDRMYNAPKDVVPFHIRDKTCAEIANADARALPHNERYEYQQDEQNIICCHTSLLPPNESE